MKKDIRATELYREAEALYQRLRAPGSGQITDASEVTVAPDGRYLAFTGTLMDRLEGTPSTRICLFPIGSESPAEAVRVLTFGPNTDRLPKYSPDGCCIAFLSDRARQGAFQLYLLDPVSGAARCAPAVNGWVEYLQWSADGCRILLGVAGHGADIAGAQGAITSKQAPEQLPPWMPSVELGNEDYRWRSVWIYDLSRDEIRQIPTPQLNIWECCWCGEDQIAASVSPSPGEGHWYTARLAIIDVSSGSARILHSPKQQFGYPVATPAGKFVAVIDAVCSDRGYVAGDVQIIDTASGERKRIDTHQVDVTHMEWRSERHLLVAGHRGFESVLGVLDADSGSYSESWSSTEITTAGRFFTVCGFGRPGDCALIGEGFTRAPEIALIRDGSYCACKSLDAGYRDSASLIASTERHTWPAEDGLQIQGWLLRPHGSAPHPLIMYVHGGPVWHWRPMWLGRAAAGVLMLLRRGYAVFFPNARGSTGRGQAYAAAIVGDMCGADARDHLAGIDFLVGESIADPARLGVTGGSYGGLLTSWLVTQDSRFAAAVSVAQVSNHVSAHLVSNIPHFVSQFLDDDFRNSGGKYFTRSPIMHADRARTPVLNICGALDRCTPPEESVQFHNALLANSVESVLVTYPQEGHGIRSFPAMIDYAARVVSWFERYIPGNPERDSS